MTKYREMLVGRWVGLMLVFALVAAWMVPTGALARVEYTNDTSATEGDPGDGLDSTGGSSGGTFELNDGEAIPLLVVIVWPMPSTVICPVFVFQKASDSGPNRGIGAEMSHVTFGYYFQAGDQ